jgi:hypothetical protein
VRATTTTQEGQVCRVDGVAAPKVAAILEQRELAVLGGEFSGGVLAAGPDDSGGAVDELFESPRRLRVGTPLYSPQPRTLP